MWSSHRRVGGKWVTESVRTTSHAVDLNEPVDPEGSTQAGVALDVGGGRGGAAVLDCGELYCPPGCCQSAPQHRSRRSRPPRAVPPPPVDWRSRCSSSWPIWMRSRSTDIVEAAKYLVECGSENQRVPTVPHKWPPPYRSTSIRSNHLGPLSPRSEGR